MMYLPCFLMAQPFYVPGGAVAGQRMKGVIHSMEGVPEGEISYTGHVGQRPKSPPEPPPPPASLQPVFSINPHPIHLNRLGNLYIVRIVGKVRIVGVGSWRGVGS
jgi:hypothetical protein